MSNPREKLCKMLGAENERLNPLSYWIQPNNPILARGIFSNSYINANMVEVLLCIVGFLFDIFAGNGYLKSILGPKVIASSLDGNPENGVLPYEAVRTVECILKLEGPVTILYMNPPPDNPAPYITLCKILKAVEDGRKDIRVVLIQEKINSTNYGCSKWPGLLERLPFQEYGYQHNPMVGCFSSVLYITPFLTKMNIRRNRRLNKKKWRDSCLKKAKHLALFKKKEADFNRIKIKQYVNSEEEEMDITHLFEL